MQGTNDKTYGAVYCWLDDDSANVRGTMRSVSGYHQYYLYSIVE